MKFHIETERLILRDLLPSDEKSMFHMDSNPEVHKYLGNKPVTTIEHVQNYIRNIGRQYINNGIGRWAVVEKSSGDTIGWGGLKFVDDKEYNNHINFYDVGYRLSPEYWRKGYATEIAIAAVDYGFNTLDINTIYGTAHVDNTGSRKALMNAGLKFVEYFPHEDMPMAWYRIDRE